MEKLFIALLLLSVPLGIPAFAAAPTSPPPPDTQMSEVLAASEPIQTISRFETKTETKTDILPYKTITKDDPDREIDDNAVITEGSNGKKVKTYSVTYFEGKEYERKLINTTTQPAVDKVIAHGTKIVWRTIDTPDGPITYWRKLHVYATHYDSHCPGCDQWTATGMKQGKGVIAVDPKVIKLYSHVYVPEYGKAVAGDTGGAIKGNIIDLGYEDAKTAGWYAHYVDIYLTK